MRYVFILFWLVFACTGPKESNQTEKVIESRPTPSPKIWNVLTSSMKQVLVKQIYLTMDSTFIEVQTTGFEEREFFGTIGGVDPIIKAFNADLDEDGFDEIYLITQSANANKFGSVLAFNSNKDKSLSMINFPPAEPGDPTFEGYAGKDIFSIEGNRLLRFFPIESSETDRRITYFLYPGEAMMQLAIEKVEDVSD